MPDFSMLAAGAQGEITLFSSLFYTKSFVLSFAFIKVLHLEKEKKNFVLLSQCAIYVINAVVVLFSAGVPLLYPESFLELPL